MKKICIIFILLMFASACATYKTTPISERDPNPKTLAKDREKCLKARLNTESESSQKAKAAGLGVGIRLATLTPANGILAWDSLSSDSAMRKERFNECMKSRGHITE